MKRVTWNDSSDKLDIDKVSKEYRDEYYTTECMVYQHNQEVEYYRELHKRIKQAKDVLTQI